MKVKFYIFILFLVLIRSFYSQSGKCFFIGHNQFNKQPLSNTDISVYQDDKKIDAFNTKDFADFKLSLPFGYLYKIVLENKRTQKMFIEVNTTTIPENKYKYKMTYEIDIPFFPKHSLNIDTTQFSVPFNKVIFDGVSKMVDDTSYNRLFLKKVYKSQETDEVKEKVNTNSPQYTNLAGSFTYQNSEKTPLINKKIILLDKAGKVLKTTNTTKLGSFVFTGVNLNEAHSIQVDFKGEFSNQTVSVSINNSQKKSLGNKITVNNKVDWQNNESVNYLKELADPKYNYKISGKLISESGEAGGGFYSNKTVFLLNDKNTVIKRTKTNVFGSFVFTEVKPGLTYLIGVDKSEVGEAQKINLYSLNDKYLCAVDSNVPGRLTKKFLSESNLLFNDLLVDDSQLRMDVKGTLYAENVNNPLSDLKIVLLNNKMEAIDTATTDGFGKFMFRYLPYMSQFNITTDDKEQLLEAINNILIYNSKDELIKIVSGTKGKKFNYKPLSSEQSQITDIYAEDPWLNLMTDNQISNNKEKIELISEPIFFESDKSELLSEAKKTLDKIILVLNSNLKIKIELSAHTDSNGNDVYNQKLSEQRAKSASDYIISKGINPSRVISKGFGETKILNRCKNGIFCADDEHKINRRLEFKISGL